MVAHGSIEVDGRDAGRIEPGHPHGAHEHQPQRVGRVLEVLVKRPCVHPSPVGLDIEALLGEGLDLVLTLADHHRHVRGLHQLDAAGQPWLLQLGQRVALCLQLNQVRGPLLAHHLVHAHGSGLVDADVHGLAQEASADEVANEVVSDCLQPLGPRQQLVLVGELPSDPAFVVVIELGVFEQLDEFV